MKSNPFRKQTGILPSYFTGRENELNEQYLFKTTKITNNYSNYGIMILILLQ